MSENNPYLISCKPLDKDLEHFSRIDLTCNNFSLGRNVNCEANFAVLSISRNHCTFKKIDGDGWEIEDQSSVGVRVNGRRIGKGNTRRLHHEDVIILEPIHELTFKFMDPEFDAFQIPKKRRKLNSSITDDNEKEADDFLNDVKVKFEESQSYEIRHLEEKIHSTKQRQEASMLLKEQLQQDMDRKMQQLESEYAIQIENLKGEKLEVEEQKVRLTEERDAQLAFVRDEMEGKIKELMEQIQKHNETESELLKENNELKEKLLKEREEFLEELHRENSSKQDLLEKLEIKMREQEEIRLREKQELEEQLRHETEQIRLAKEKELKELEEQKKKLEEELMKELDDIKKNLAKQVEETEQERLKAQEMLNSRVEEMKKISEEEKSKMEQLIHEKESILVKLSEAECNAEKEMKELKERITQREVELQVLAAERIQKHTEQSSEVISSLQEQLAKTRSQLESLETEKNTLLESLGLDNPGEGTSKRGAMDEVGELMDSELQCSICAELFIVATTLNCSHTFCKYCITMWKKKKKDCPICRAHITSECRSIVLDSFIEKAVEKSEEMKKKRQEMLKAREELEAELARSNTAEADRRRSSFNSSSYESEFVEEEEEDYDLNYGDDYGDDLYDSYDEFDFYDRYSWRRRRYYDYSDSDSGSDESASDTGAGGVDDPAGSTAAAAGAAGGAAAGLSGASGGAAADASGLPDHTTGRSDNNGGRRRGRGIVPGLPGAAYGGYGRCYRCGARGHWAPGCPTRAT